MTQFIPWEATHRVIFRMGHKVYQGLAQETTCQCAACRQARYPYKVFHSRLPNGLAYARWQPRGRTRMSRSPIVYLTLRSADSGYRAVRALKIEEL